MTKQEEIREGMQRLWCQHCKAMQKTNNTVVECWYNPLNDEKAFCASNVDAIDAILKDQSNKGVVIKVDRELPEGLYLSGDFRHPNWLSREELKSIMDVAVEPLI